MPYISTELREQVDLQISRLIAAIETTDDIVRAGVLNYTITRLLQTIVSNERPSYADVNTAIGVLQCASAELYRRIAVPYENQKMFENGDVDTFDPSQLGTHK